MPPSKRTLMDVFREMRTISYYDCFELGERLVNGLRLFGNENIGRLEFTNLQIPGQMPGDRSFIVQRWYARTNLPESGPIRDAFRIWAHGCVSTFQIGYSRTWTMSLAELVDRRPRTTDDAARATRLSDGDPWPEFIPTRQNFSVQVDRFQEGAFDRLRAEIERDPRYTPDRIINSIDPLVWIHLEGIVIPEGINTDKIFELVTAREGKIKSAEETIVAWLVGQSAHPETTDASRAQLDAIADAIREERHR